MFAEQPRDVALRTSTDRGGTQQRSGQNGKRNLQSTVLQEDACSHPLVPDSRTWKLVTLRYCLDKYMQFTRKPQWTSLQSSVRRGGMQQPHGDDAEQTEEQQLQALARIERSYCLICQCWMSPRHQFSEDHMLASTQLFALGSETSRTLIAARRFSFEATHEVEMIPVIDPNVYIRDGARRYCLGCQCWAGWNHDNLPFHRTFLEQLHAWSAETQEQFLAQRAQRTLEIMRDPVARGGMPVTLRSRSEVRADRHPTRTNVRLRSRSPVAVSKEVEKQMIPDLPPQQRRLPEHVVTYRNRPYCLLCDRWDDQPHRQARRHIQRVYDFMAHEPTVRAGMVKDWTAKLLAKRAALETMLDDKRIYVFQKDWAYCLACQQWEDGIRAKSEKHLKRVKWFADMTRLEQGPLSCSAARSS